MTYLHEPTNLFGFAGEHGDPEELSGGLSLWLQRRLCAAAARVPRRLHVRCVRSTTARMCHLRRVCHVSYACCTTARVGADSIAWIGQSGQPVILRRLQRDGGGGGSGDWAWRRRLKNQLLQIAVGETTSERVHRVAKERRRRRTFMCRSRVCSCLS